MHQQVCIATKQPSRYLLILYELKQKANHHLHSLQAEVDADSKSHASDSSCRRRRAHKSYMSSFGVLHGVTGVDAEICWRLTTRPTWDGDVEAYSEADLYFSLWKIWRSIDSPLNQFIFAIWISTGSGPQEAYAKLTKAKYKNFHGLITKAENKRNVQKINTWNHKSFLVSTCAFKPLFHI